MGDVATYPSAAQHRVNRSGIPPTPLARASARVPLTLVHGEQDTNAPTAMVRRAVAEMRGARLVTYPGEAHFSTLCNHINEVARALVG